MKTIREVAESARKDRIEGKVLKKKETTRYESEDERLKIQVGCIRETTRHKKGYQSN